MYHLLILAFPELADRWLVMLDTNKQNRDHSMCTFQCNLDNVMVIILLLGDSEINHHGLY